MRKLLSFLLSDILTCDSTTKGTDNSEKQSIVYWLTLGVSYIMLPVLMGHKGVACWAELLADRTFKARSLHVFGLNVPGECCAVLCTIITFTAIPQTIRTLGHLVLDRRNQLLWTRFQSLLSNQNQDRNISKQLVVFLTVALVDMALKGIFCWAELIAVLTGIPIRLEVPWLNIICEGCLVLGHKVTLTATPSPITLLHHPLLNCFFQLIWARIVSINAKLGHSFIWCQNSKSGMWVHPTVVHAMGLPCGKMFVT